MNNEQARFETFVSWPSNAPVDSVKIARAGFYYTGNALEVICHFCNKQITTWTFADQVMLKHRLLSPDCPFVLNPLDCSNIPIKPNSSKHNENINNLVKLNGNMEDVFERIKTYFNDPIFIPVQMYLLAVNGFYAVNTGDNIQCIECKLLLQDWIGTIDPILHHKEQKPSCSKNNYSHLHSIKNKFDLPEYITGAYDKEFSKFEKRLQTYDCWPHKQPDPESLSFAGLYFTKENDFVRCYFCDIGLRQWLHTDNPLVEHARNSPTCKYINMLTTKSFINACSNSENIDQTKHNNICKLEAEIRDLKETRLCKICLDRDIAMAFVPCGHLLSCEQCAIGLIQCPLCRGKIFTTVRTYLS